MTRPQGEADAFPRAERVDGPTPAGGDYSVALYDGAGNLVEIHECAADGTVLQRTYAAVPRPPCLLPDGPLLVPARAEGPGGELGDGLIRLEPGTPEHARWLASLSAPISRAASRRSAP